MGSGASKQSTKSDAKSKPAVVVKRGSAIEGKEGQFTKGKTSDGKGTPSQSRSSVKMRSGSVKAEAGSIDHNRNIDKKRGSTKGDDKDDRPETKIHHPMSRKPPGIW